MIYDADQIWPSAKPHLYSDECLGRAVLTRMCDNIDMNQRDNRKQFSDSTIGELHLAIRHWFPPSSDPPYRSGEMTSDDVVRRIRGKLPQMLAERATESGCRELLRLSEAVPAEEATWLRWIYKDAVTNIRRNLWQPPSIVAVKKILDQADARLLTCDEDLLDLVVESLDRLQIRLKQQSLPQAEVLWRWSGSGNNRFDFKPKDEEAISDYIADWLSTDIGPRSGVVVNREVQPRRGSRTDIYVEAFAPDEESSLKKLTVIIEVKGCWHSNVCTGLENQLVKGYLEQHGWR